LEDLVASIKVHGVLQPITVTEKVDGGYELIAGERRLRASQIAGRPTIPAIVKQATQVEKLELALIENIQRQDLNPIEEAFAYQRLMDEFHLTQEEVGERVGKSRPTVANLVRLLDLPQPIQKALMDGVISAGKAKALLSLKDEKEQFRVFADMVGHGMSVRAVEQTVSGHDPASRKGSVRRDPNLMAQEKLLEERLGTKVMIHKKGEKGTIVIDFSSLEELKRLVGELS
jgi:ParB family chromosome partitioning protein